MTTVRAPSMPGAPRRAASAEVGPERGHPARGQGRGDRGCDAQPLAPDVRVAVERARAVEDQRRRGVAVRLGPRQGAGQADAVVGDDVEPLVHRSYAVVDSR
jgi:hypothetical protein